MAANVGGRTKPLDGSVSIYYRTHKAHTRVSRECALVGFVLKTVAETPERGREISGDLEISVC